MKNINKQLDEEIFDGYFCFCIRRRPQHHVHPHPRQHLNLRHILSYRLQPLVIDKLHVGWNYGESVLELL